MFTTWLRSGFFSRYRIEILMWALIAEMLASPLADTHSRAGALLGLLVLLIVLFGITIDGHLRRGFLWAVLQSTWSFLPVSV